MSRWTLRLPAALRSPVWLGRPSRSSPDADAPRSVAYDAVSSDRPAAAQTGLARGAPEALEDGNMVLHSRRKYCHKESPHGRATDLRAIFNRFKEGV